MGAVVVYAQTPARRARQVAGDVLLLVWVGLWVLVGVAVHDATVALAEPGRRIEAGAGEVAGHLEEAGRAAGDIPMVGDELAAPFSSAGRAAGEIAAAGRRQVEVVEHLAVLLGTATAAVPVLVVLLAWLPLRVRFARRATAARRFVDSDADLRLFALRAMANQPMQRLARVCDDPVGAWRADDRQVLRRLAALELRDAGLRDAGLRDAGPRPPLA